VLAAAWIAYWLVLGLLGVYGVHRLHLIVLYWLHQHHRRSGHTTAPAVLLPAKLPGELPVVTVQLPLFNEMYVAERLIDAVAALDWPRDRLEIQILDDSTDETADLCRRKAETLRAAGHDVHYLHRGDRAGFKAGALQAGLTRARGELILILDADFVPRPGLLRDTVGHFADPEIGMVQVRWEHLNRESSALTRVQALLLDGHFVIEQSVRARTGRFFNFNGTAGLWRREAIHQAGGWQHDTLTEDLDLSYRVLLCGWRFVYLLDHAAPAELPADMNAFKSQQFRWAKGSVQVARKLLPEVLGARLPARIKLEAFFHLTQNLPYFLTLLLVLLSVPALVLRPAQPGEMLWLHLPALAMTMATLGAYCVTSQHALTRGLWRALTYLPALIGVTAGICLNQSRAVLEGALGRPSEFVRTPKHGIVDPDPGSRTDRGPLPGAGRPWRGLRYRGLRDLMPVAELALALYLAAALLLIAHDQRWSMAPVFTILCAGFLYVGLGSALRR
jgi:hypothetical protein